MKIKCSHDLYDGDVVSGKWYEAACEDDGTVNFKDETGFRIYCLPDGNCPHLVNIPGAF